MMEQSLKYMAFGDIHGCAPAAKTAVSLAETQGAIAIFLGDYVDRGPDSIGTIEILIQAKEAHPAWQFIRGNHDQMLLDLILKHQIPDQVFEVYSGRTSNHDTSKVYRRWLDLPTDRQDSIKSFLQNTIFYHETEHCIFLHAPLKNSHTTLTEKPNEELIWNYSFDPIWEGKPFVHGHKPVQEPVNEGKGYNINTHCGYGGFLTGALIDNEAFAQTEELSANNPHLTNFFIRENGELNPAG